MHCRLDRCPECGRARKGRLYYCQRDSVDQTWPLGLDPYLGHAMEVALIAVHRKRSMGTSTRGQSNARKTMVPEQIEPIRTLRVCRDNIRLDIHHSFETVETGYG